ncbi:hypothetical protein AB3S75_007187 [Citrus x aurantiifolia]
MEFSFKKLKLFHSKRFNKRMKWCGHCLRLCMVTRCGEFICCSICGKILADWSTEQKKYKMMMRRRRHKKKQK